MLGFGKIHFKKTGEQELLMKVIHRHWFDIFQQFIVVLLGAAVLVGGFFVLPDLIADFSPNMEGASMYALIFFIESTVAMFLWFYLSLVWIDYYLDIWIVTTERIINIEQKGAFVRHVSELKLVNIQDVTTEVNGMLPTMLDYGDVYIQTAAEETRFVFRKVPDPYHIKSEIMSLQKQALQRNSQNLSKMINEGEMNM